MDIRDRARTYLAQVPLVPGEIWSDRDEPLFKKLSGITHNQLLESWGLKVRTGEKVARADPPPGLTSCNSFVALYAGDGGIGIAQKNRSLGQFGLDKKLAGWGKSFAWVPATPGARPKFGDIFENATTLHQGVSLEFEGGTWNTAEGGQGGKKSLHDIIKRKAMPQSGDALIHTKGPIKGWVDIELFANGPAKPAPVTMPGWLPGWWEVPWRGRFFYYFFEPGFKASWTYAKPISDAFAPLQFSDTATVAIDGPASITITWSATSSVEKFTLAGTDRIMTGLWNAAEVLVATKMF